MTNEQLEERIIWYRQLLKKDLVEWRLKEVDEVFALAHQGLQFQKLSASYEQERNVCDTLTAELTAAEAKVERMKLGIETLVGEVAKRNLGAANEIESAFAKLKQFSVEPPSTSLNLYHKERNKKEFGEVTGQLNFALVAPTRDQMTQRIEQALSILKRLTE